MANWLDFSQCELWLGYKISGYAIAAAENLSLLAYRSYLHTLVGPCVSLLKHDAWTISCDCTCVMSFFFCIWCSFLFWCVKLSFFCCSLMLHWVDLLMRRKVMLFWIIWVFRDNPTLGLFTTGFFVYITILRGIIAVLFMFGVLYPAYITLFWKLQNAKSHPCSMCQGFCKD